MKHTISILTITLCMVFGLHLQANEPDSAYIFAYGSNKGDGRGGLRMAWSLDSKSWHSIGNHHSFLNSDFGRWGSQKRMHEPFLFQDDHGRWHCLWTLNDENGIIAHTTSDNLTYWKPQSYAYVFEGKGNCRNIEMKYRPDRQAFFITWEDTQNGNGLYGTCTQDFKRYGTPEQTARSARSNARQAGTVDGEEYTGTVHKVAWTTVDHLMKTCQLKQYQNSLYDEKMAEDPIRFAHLKPVEATVNILPEQSKAISDMLVGIFFEDINYAADGGLYAELIRNRDFEFSAKDNGNWNARTAWETTGTNIRFSIETRKPIHENNAHYAVLNVSQVGEGIVNEGFDGISLFKGAKYDYSFFAFNPDGKKKKVKFRLVDENGKIYGEAVSSLTSSTWKKFSGVITAKESTAHARLEVIPQSEGQIALDMISLFPQKTFKGRKNGLRADLAQTLADIKPRFIRFPGGCVAHGDGIDNIYNWKNTIGPLETRKPDRNLWGYHQSMGLGYFEYFQFCEDIGAEPLPVIAAGVPCQNSGAGGHGQQCGIPMNRMDEYIQDIFDLIEWANGDPKKNKWANMRAEAGHPAPFGLKYIGIGNEDLISELFEERFAMICQAIQKQYPDINIIGTAGPFYEGSDYTEGWRIATETGIPLIDEHYYVSPGWFIHNQDYYDRYDRSKPKVYLGEYAAHLPGRPNNIETALAEALHLANIERNGDVVSLTSYAPLLAKEGHTQWNPDLIYFNNTEVKKTVGYYVQKLYGNNAGDEYLPCQIKLSDNADTVKKRMTCSVVHDSNTGDVIVKLVNLLPVEVKTVLNTETLGTLDEIVDKTVLAGKPDDKNARPVASTTGINDLNSLALPPYSFTVLRLHTSK